MCGDCVVTCTSTRSPTRSAEPASGSMYACSTKPVSKTPSTSTSAAANASSRSPRRTLPRIRTLPSRASWSRGRTGGLRVVDRHHRSQLFPGHRERRHVERRHRLGLADDHRDRLTPEAHLAIGLGEHRLIGGRRDHAEPVAAGDVRRGHDRDDPRRGGDERVQVAQREARAMEGRAHDRGSRALRQGPRRSRRRPCRPPCARRRRAARDDPRPCPPAAAAPASSAARAFITAAMILR